MSVPNIQVPLTFVRARTVALILASLAIMDVAATRGDEPKPYSGAGCSAPVDEFFINEVWGKVAAQSCVNCHKEGGDAEDSEFVLQDLRKIQGEAQAAGMLHNRNAFARMAKAKEGSQSRLLTKVT